MKNYAQLCIAEREKIQKWLWEKKSIRYIADQLHRAPSTISRELKRNYPKINHQYTPRLAQERAIATIKERGKRARLKDPRIKQYVVSKLKQDFSPEQIAGTIGFTHKALSISHEAIYQFVYSQYYRQGYGECIGLDLRGCLKRKHRQRKRKLVPFASEVGKMQGITRIGQRPEIVDTRKRIGDWEGDSMVSRQSSVSLNTLVERKSGYVIITKLNNQTKLETTRAVIKKLGTIPKRFRHTLTLDNGKENWGHKDLETNLGINVYFANPYHSWERGTNENTNGLIRHYLPKGTDFATVHVNTLRAIERKLNHRPRKRLKYRTPHQIFNGVLH